MPIVELVKVGSLGFATAILFLSYRLLNKLMESERFEGENLLVRCRVIQIFMGASIAVILIGMTWELTNRFIDPDIIVRFDVTPTDTAGVKVKVHGKIIDLTTNDGIPMRDEYQVSLNLVEIDRRIRRLNRDMEYLGKRAEGSNNELNVIKKKQVRDELETAAFTEESGI